MANRTFTLDEANAQLPFLEEHLQRLQVLQKSAQARFEEMEKIKAVGYDGEGKLILLYDFKRAKEEFDRTVADANDVIGKINETGCHLKNIEMGLVDFPGRLHEENILWCWQLGEPSILYYHDHLDGFNGRRPIPPAFANPTRPEEPDKNKA